MTDASHIKKTEIGQGPRLHTKRFKKSGKHASKRQTPAKSVECGRTLGLETDRSPGSGQASQAGHGQVLKARAKVKPLPDGAPVPYNQKALDAFVLRQPRWFERYPWCVLFAKSKSLIKK